MNWFSAAILSYFILAVVFLIDKYLLTKSIPDPKVYSFYIGILGAAAVFLVPFIDFYIPDPYHFFLSFMGGATFVLGIFWFFKGLKLFEPSRIAPAVGGISPILTFLLLYSFSGIREVVNFKEVLSFIMLILGAILITHERSKRISLQSLKISFIAALFFALSFIFTKYVYLDAPFLLGLIWIKLGGALFALTFLFSGKLRNSLAGGKIGFQKKASAILLTGQAMGAGAGILQNWAIAMAPLAYLAFIGALQAMQYVFLLIIAVFLSLKFPNILKEEISSKTILQKVLAILLISGGLVILAIK